MLLLVQLRDSVLLECDAGKRAAYHFLTGGVLAARRRLLARLCLVREELGVAAADMGAGVEAFDEARSTYQRLLPQGAAAFIKELLAVSQPERRCGCAPWCCTSSQPLQRCRAAVHLLTELMTFGSHVVVAYWLQRFCRR